MKILFNGTSLVKGGGVQRGVAFIKQAMHDSRGHTWCFAYNGSMEAEIGSQSPSARWERFTRRPSQCRDSRNRLLALEREFEPDCIYTLFGPAYVRFKAPHLLGVADPWVTHPTWLAYRTLRFPDQWAKVAAVSAYKASWFRHADAWAIETEAASAALRHLLRVPPSAISVVPNTYAEHYNCEKPLSHSPEPQAGPVRILSFCAPYAHKRLDLIPWVARELRRMAPHLKFCFVVTLPADCGLWQSIQRTAKRCGVVDCLENRGRIPVEHGPALYRTCQVCFLPTVLETSSASYPEAMAMSKPIVTSDLDFARAACGNAALYFKPNDIADAARQLLAVIQNAAKRDRVVAAGHERLKSIPSAVEQYHLQVALLERLADCKEPERSDLTPLGTLPRIDSARLAAAAQTS